MVKFAKPKKRLRNTTSDMIGNIILIVVGIILILKYADTKDYVFWLAAVVEVVLAVITVRIRRYIRNIPFWLSVVALFVPLILVAGSSQLKPILLSPFVFICVAESIMTYLMAVHRFRSKTSFASALSNFAFEVVLPNNLPLELEEVDYHAHKTKQQTTLNIYYENNDDARLFIYESNGALDRPEIKRPSENSEKLIKGISVKLVRAIPRKAFFRNAKKPPLVKAAWTQKGINFNILADWIPEEDVLKIIESMIK